MFRIYFEGPIIAVKGAAENDAVVAETAFGKVRGVDVQHIIGAGKLTPATMTSFAKPDGTQITYPSV